MLRFRLPFFSFSVSFSFSATNLQQRIFVAEQREQGRISSFGYDCRSNGTNILLKSEEKPVGLAIDRSEGRLFWSNDYDYPHQANVSWITTSTTKNVTDKKRVLNNVIDPQGMTVDPVAKKLYYTEHSGYKVSKSNYNGSDIEVLVERPGDVAFQPADVKIDRANDRMFVTVEKSPENIAGTLYMMYLNGTNVTKITDSDLKENYGLCIDTHMQHVYYVIGGHGGGTSRLRKRSVLHRVVLRTNASMTSDQPPLIFLPDPCAFVLSRPHATGSCLL